MNRKEIAEKIKETKTWHDCDEKRMALRALYSMASRRAGQVEFKPDVWLDVCDLRIPKGFSFLHMIGLCDWLNYDDNNRFDGTRRICLRCGKSESTMMNRVYADYRPNGYDDLNRAILLDFIRAYLRGKQ